MITFIDEKGTEHSALVAYSVTNAVNGELSVKGTIYTNDKVLHGIGRGWRFRLDDEYYRITYAKPNDTGRQIEVEFDAVHQFFYDMSKSVLYETLDGSKPLKNYLDTIFSSSGYTYSLEESAGSIRKENFGNKSRLSLFNDIIKAAGLEFSVRGHVVRILKRIGTDLSTIVRKDFNMNELKIEKDINSFVTYQRGLGAWKDDEDRSKGRYETSYESPLAKIYGRIEAEPVVDERYKETGKLLERLKENVDKSYKVSVEIDMEDLSQAGYRISRPNPGDYIMAINETLGFCQKVRIVSFTSEYDVGGNLISRKVVCNDIGTVQRVTSEISHLSRTLADSIEGSERALQTATRALVSADGKNTNYFGDVKPLDVPKGTLRKGDRLFLTVGDKKQLYFWNGAEWELEPTEFDHEKFDMEFNRKSQEIKKDIQENRQKSEAALQNAGASSLLAQEAKRIGLDSISKLEEFKKQAMSAQTVLSGDLDVLKRTVNNEVNQASEHRRTITEALSRMTGQMDGFATKSEVKQDINGLTQTFAKMKVGGRNLLRGSKGPFLPDRKPANFDNNILYVGNTSIYMEQGQKYTISAKTDGNFTALHENKESDNVVLWIMDKDARNYQIVSDLKTGTTGTKIIWNKPTGIYHLRVNTYHKEATKSVWDVKIEKGNIATDWSPAIEDVESQITEAMTEFKQTADGLSTKMAAVETYVGQDNQRQEVLRRYTRDESAKQATAVRELVTRDYVGKLAYQEDVRGIERKFEGITNSQNGLIATKIADYKHSVDGRFADITSLIAGKANQTDFQRVRETSQLYERILGNTENGITDKVARMALTNQLFQVEVAKNASNGQNLLKGTKGFSGNWKNMAVGWKKHSDKYQGCDVLFKNNSWNGIGQEIDAKIGEIYTFSLWMKSDWKNDTVNFYVNRNGSVEKGWGVPSQTSIAITNEWKRYSFTFKITANGFIFPRVERLNQDTNLYVAGLKLEKGSYATPYTEAPEDTDEAIRSVQSQLAGSWGVHNKNSVNEIIAGFNLAGRNAGIKAETIRLEGNTLADKLTAIDGYFKRLFVGEGTFATLNADVIRTNSITADKLVFNEALANRLVSNEHVTNKLVASRAFVNALKTVTIDASQIVTGTLTGDKIYGGTIRGAEINGTRITGDSRITIGNNGFLRPTQYGGLQINVPETYNANKGVGIQIFGRKLGIVPKGMFIYNAPSWVGGDFEVGESVSDTLLTVKGLTSLCNLFDGKPMSGLPINSNFSFGSPVPELFRVSFIAWDARIGQLMVNDGTNTKGTWWFKPDLSTSDKRLKVNIRDTNFEATDFVKKLEFKQFDWKPDKFGYKKPYTNVGLIAQDVEKLDSSLVYPQGENLALDDFRLGNIALKAIQELSQRIETLERKLA